MSNGQKQRKTLGSTGLTYHDAVAIQERLRERLSLEPPGGEPAAVAGADVAFTADRKRAVGGMVALSWPDLEVLDVAVAVREADFPYVPGLLSFREIPVLAEVFRRLKVRPDVLFCDGQGFAHPRRFGLACHLGVELDTPTVGCAKSVLVGEFDEPGPLRGSRAEMRDGGEVIGMALRTRDNVRPVYVSPGHMMDLETASELVLGAGGGYRLPEPTRLADKLVGRAKRRLGGRGG